MTITQKPATAAVVFLPHSGSFHVVTIGLSQKRFGLFGISGRGSSAYKTALVED